ncbi:MAG TPA: alpha/beta fold hydrolase, partial [Thermoanaerobaculia bacterium]|nr:alpha/beta fold hydrolase [Thermoanaerobaculia bacterium]
CIAFDFRGQGESEITESGYDVDSLTEDTAAVIETLGAAPCHFVGLSMGGFVGLRLALRRSSLLRSLVLVDSSADVETFWDRLRYGAMIAVARRFGLRPVIGPLLRVMFSERLLRNRELRTLWRDRVLAIDRVAAIRAVEGVLSRASVYDDLGTITTPTLIVVGQEDRTTPPARARRMHDAIPGSRLVVLPEVGHMASIEAPEALTEAIREFVRGATAIEPKRERDA